MMTSTPLAPPSSDPPEPFTGQLRLAVAAYLARFTGSSREHTESDLRCYLVWCAERGLDPLAAQRPHLELYIRWMQEIRRFKPSTVSRRFSVAAGFYRTCVLDGIMEHSPAEHVRRPPVPAESPTLGFTHLQSGALLTAARESANPCDFALVAMLGLLGLRIFEATSADIADLGEEHGHRVLRVCGKGTKIVLVPLPPAVGRAIDRAVGARVRGPILLNTRGARMDRHAAARRLHRLAEAAGIQVTRAHPHMLRHTYCMSRPCSTLALTYATCRSPPGTLTREPRCGMTGPAATWTATRTTSWPPTWRPAPDPVPCLRPPRLMPWETPDIADERMPSVGSAALVYLELILGLWNKIYYFGQLLWIFDLAELARQDVECMPVLGTAECLADTFSLVEHEDLQAV
jgi:integrase/recombinase XerD